MGNVVLRRRGLLIAICLLMFAHVVSAQTETPTSGILTFPLELKYVDPPTLPPKDWTYPGMILMSGYAGIHAMQADWDTPRVVAQFNVDQNGNAPIDGGQLSPNENWYALPMGEVFTEVSNNQFWYIRALKVFSLRGDDQSIWLDLTNYDSDLNDNTAFIFAPLVWNDSQTLTVGSLLIHPFDNRLSDAPFFTMSLIFEPKVFSPDVTSLYGTYDTSFNEGIFNLANMSLTKALSDLIYVAWRPDSSGFMGQPQEKNQTWHGLAYFDQDGNLIDHIISFDSNPYNNQLPLSGRSEQAWSPDGHYFAFIANRNSKSVRLYLVDMQERDVLVTCLNAASSPVWSPDGTMFAYLADAPENLYLIVVDTKTWKSYIVARQSGARGRFGSPEMIGWRSTTQAQ